MAATHVYVFVILFSAFFICRSDNVPDCVYTVYVQTGSIVKAGTDSVITLSLYDAARYGLRISNLEQWGGRMGPGYNYFENGNLDIFSGRGPCLPGPVCSMNLTSDGTGEHHGWYVKYVEVTSTGIHVSCAKQKFNVDQWLATDTRPYELTAIRNNCPPSLSSSSSESVIGRSDSPLLTII